MGSGDDWCSPHNCPSSRAALQFPAIPPIMLTRDGPCVSAEAGWGGRDGRGAMLVDSGGRVAVRAASAAGLLLLQRAPVRAHERGAPDLAGAGGGDAARAG